MVDAPVSDLDQSISPTKDAGSLLAVASLNPHPVNVPLAISSALLQLRRCRHSTPAPFHQPLLPPPSVPHPPLPPHPVPPPPRHQFRTVSDYDAPNHARDTREFLALDQFLREAYPLVFQQLEVEKVRRPWCQSGRGQLGECGRQCPGLWSSTAAGGGQGREALVPCWLGGG